MPEKEQEIQAYRITDRAADLIDAAIVELGITDAVAWDVIPVPQSDRGPCLGVFWTEPGAILGTVVSALGLVPLPFDEEKALDGVRACREQSHQMRTAQLQQAQQAQDGQNGHHPGGPPGIITP